MMNAEGRIAEGFEQPRKGGQFFLQSRRAQPPSLG